MPEDGSTGVCYGQLTPRICAHSRGSWVRKGLIVKVMAKELKEQGLYKAKGVIIRLPRPAVAEVSTFDPEAIVQVSARRLGTQYGQQAYEIRL